MCLSFLFGKSNSQKNTKPENNPESEDDDDEELDLMDLYMLDDEYF